MALTTRMKALKNLQKKFQAGSSQVQRGVQAAQDIQLQQAVQQAAPTAGIREAQRAGGVAAQQAGKAAVAEQQRVVGQAGQVAGLQLGEQAREIERKGAARMQVFDLEQIRKGKEFAKLNEDAKENLFVARAKLQQDAMGQAFLNQRQLADFAIMQGKDQQAFANYAQQAKQMSERKIAMMNMAHQKLTQVLKQGYMKKGQELDQATRKRITQARIDLKEKMAKEQAEAESRSAAWQSGGMIAGTVAGAVIGSFTPLGPVGGAAIGAQAGGAGGTLAQQYFG